MWRAQEIACLCYGKCIAWYSQQNQIKKKLKNEKPLNNPE